MFWSVRKLTTPPAQAGPPTDVLLGQRGRAVDFVHTVSNVALQPTGPNENCDHRFSSFHQGGSSFRSIMQVTFASTVIELVDVKCRGTFRFQPRLPRHYRRASDVYSAKLVHTPAIRLGYRISSSEGTCELSLGRVKTAWRRCRDGADVHRRETRQHRNRRPDQALVGVEIGWAQREGAATAAGGLSVQPQQQPRIASMGVSRRRACDGIGAAGGVVAQLDDPAHVEHVVEAAVPGPGQRVAQMLAAGHVDRGGAGLGREVVAVGEPADVAHVGEDAGCARPGRCHGCPSGASR